MLPLEESGKRWDHRHKATKRSTRIKNFRAKTVRRRRRMLWMNETNRLWTLVLQEPRILRDLRIPITWHVRGSRVKPIYVLYLRTTPTWFFAFRPCQNLVTEQYITVRKSQFLSTLVRELTNSASWSAASVTNQLIFGPNTNITGFNFSNHPLGSICRETLTWGSASRSVLVLGRCYPFLG